MLSPNFFSVQGDNPGIMSGLNADKPASTLIGMLYVTTDTNTIYRWNGATWVTIGGGGSFVPTSRTLTIGGITQDLSANRTWSNLVINGTQNVGVTINANNAAGLVLTSSSTTNISGSASTNAIMQFSPSGLRTIRTTVNPIGTSMSNMFEILGTVNQSGAGGYAALAISLTETATGSGAKNIVDCRVGGANRFRVDNAGNVNFPGTITTGSGGGGGILSWLLGGVTTAAVAVDTTRYLNVNVGGVAYKLIVGV